MRPAGLVLFLVFLGACQSASLPYEDSPYSVIPAGSRLVLERDLTIPAGRASLYIQGGEVRAYAEIDPYRPHCRLEVQKVLATPQVVKADRFVMEKVIYEEIPRLASAARAPVRLAAAGDLGIAIGEDPAGRRPRGWPAAVAFGMADGSSPWTYATHFRLRSDRQPEVRLLTCQHWDDPALAVHLAVRQIRATLGGIFTLEILSRPDRGG